MAGDSEAMKLLLQVKSHLEDYDADWENANKLDDVAAALRETEQQLAKETEALERIAAPQMTSVTVDELRHFAAVALAERARCADGLHFFRDVAVCECGKQGSATVRAEGREGMVTVYDELGRYLGCMGVETWRAALREGAEE